VGVSGQSLIPLRAARSGPYRPTIRLRCRVRSGGQGLAAST
jgi:hypothetical protein